MRKIRIKETRNQELLHKKKVKRGKILSADIDEVDSGMSFGFTYQTKQNILLCV